MVGVLGSSPSVDTQSILPAYRNAKSMLFFSNYGQNAFHIIVGPHGMPDGIAVRLHTRRAVRQHTLRQFRSFVDYHRGALLFSRLQAPDHRRGLG